MNPEDALRTAARTIGQMPEADIQRKFAQLQEARRTRSQREAFRHQAETDSLELDEAAYQAALKYEEVGDLRTAARWYSAAAVSDFPGASLRLASVLSVLSALAAEHPVRAESQAGQAMNEAALEWAAKAFAAGEVGASRLIGELDARLDPAVPLARPAPVSPHSATETPSSAGSEPAADQCTLGGLRNATRLDPDEMTRHYRSCASCQAEQATRPTTPTPAQR